MQLVRLSIRLLLTITLASLLACGGDGQRSTDGRVATPTLINKEGVAIDGYDSVAYFTLGVATLGNNEHALEYNGATYWFASEENRARFESNPTQYVSAYGGWGAYGMANGYAAQTDPVNGWTVHDGRLYLNWSEDVAQDWRADKVGYLQASEANWPKVKSALSQGEAEVYWHEG